MMGSFLTRVLLMGLGCVYPAYECYKTVEKHDLEIEQLKFWCQYWIIVALLAVCERVGDNIISWLPLYGEAKLALVLSLWHPKTRATVHFYSSFLRPYVAKHQQEIDLNLAKMKENAAMVANLAWQKALSYGQKRFLEVLQFISYQSAICRSQTHQESTSKL
ncbi:putative HVA22-like protein g [Primulina huaijiensis]|uniref:putative HVA22-like protein g n=1 Tax=Primulina huaijiensis TaxID=1492673 RepID=UPI003CC78F8D